MSKFLVLTIIADDKPGIVETLAATIADQKGNWLESRMTHLAGKFAGIIHLQIASSHSDALQNALEALARQGWMINIERRETQIKHENQADAMLNIVGNDRPGIVKEVSQVLANLHINVLELSTHFESAAMTAEALFKTQAHIQLPTNLDIQEVCDQLEELSNDLMVEVQKS